MDYETLVELIKSKMSDLQEALDKSPLAEKAGACIPIDNMLTAILAAYYYLNEEEVDIKADQPTNPDTGSDDEGSGKEEVDASTSSNITPYLPVDTDWSMVDWERRVLGDSDKDSKSERGYNPNNCLFWVPKSKDNDPYGFWDTYDEDNNFVNIVSIVADMFDYGSVSYKEFNRVHFHKTDRNFTIGFQHLTNDNVLKFFKEYILSNDLIYNELCHYFVHRLNKKDDNMAQSYRLQAADDEILKPVLFPDKSGDEKITTEMADAISLDKWEEAIEHFFSTNGLLQDTKKVSELTKKNRLRFALWAENQMIKYNGENNFRTVKKEENPDYVYPFKSVHYGEYNGYPACDLVELFQRVTRKEKKDVYDNPISYKSGFWFHDILKDALMLKSVAAEQIRYWWDKFYIVKIKKNYEKDLGVSSYIIDSGNNKVYRDVRKDKTLSAAICIYSAVRNNSFKMDGCSKRDDSNQWVKYDGKIYTIEEKQYSSGSGNIEDDRTMTMILLLGMLYETQHPGRSRTLYMLEKYWKDMWLLNGEKLTKVPKLEDYSKISRKKG